MQRHGQIFLAGLLAVLPLIVTVAAIIWMGDLLLQLIGPHSIIGEFLISLGLTVATRPAVAYPLGFVIVLLSTYVLGLLVQFGLKNQLQTLDQMLRKVPLMGPIYDLTSRFVDVFQQQSPTDLKTMSPVWCFLGGEGGTAVLALMPTPEVIVLGGHRYHVIVVPSAPVPLGGGLLYVPEAWIKPANFGVDKLTSIYVSMGVSSSATDGTATPLEPSRSE